VNTISFAGGRAVGDTTDGPGFLNALRRIGQARPRRAVILGTGGVARAIGFALRGIGAHVSVSGRTRPRAAALAADLDGDDIRLDADALRTALEQADLLVNATPVGGPGEEQRSPLPDGVIPHAGLTVFDSVYRPRITPLLRDAMDAGAHTIEGVDMLVEQGARSFEIWTGVQPPVEVMRAAAIAALEENA
jgi:shikimate dehydrogenase